VTTTPLNDLPAQDLRYRLVATSTSVSTCIAGRHRHSQDHDTSGIALRSYCFVRGNDAGTSPR
jgi:hypothetical protein